MDCTGEDLLLGEEQNKTENNTLGLPSRFQTLETLTCNTNVGLTLRTESTRSGMDFLTVLIPYILCLFSHLFLRTSLLCYCILCSSLF